MHCTKSYTHLSHAHKGCATLDCALQSGVPLTRLLGERDLAQYSICQAGLSTLIKDQASPFSMGVW